MVNRQDSARFHAVEFKSRDITLVPVSVLAIYLYLEGESSRKKRFFLLLLRYIYMHEYRFQRDATL